MCAHIRVELQVWALKARIALNSKQRTRALIQNNNYFSILNYEPKHVQCNVCMYVEKYIFVCENIRNCVHKYIIPFTRGISAQQ